MNSNDPNGNPRDSDGFLAQATYKIGATKLGVNYGQSNLKRADGETAPLLVAKNDKFTVGVYQDLTTNLILVGEISRLESKNRKATRTRAPTSTWVRS